MTLGLRVAAKRKEKGLTQGMLAEKLNLTAAYISQIEKGQRNPSYGVLIKLAHAFDTSLSYFLGAESTSAEEPSSRFVENAIRFLAPEQKEKLVTYIYQLAGVTPAKDFPILSTPVEYPPFILNQLKYDTLPVDPFCIAEKLGVEIVHSSRRLEQEAILYKTEKPIIILDDTIKSPARQRFTIAMMLGHLVIPWHLRPTFYRERDKTSLDQEDQLEMEAREFAGELIIPSKQFARDVEGFKPSLELFESIASDQYGCSMTALMHKYINRRKKPMAFITSKDGCPNRVYSAELTHSFRGTLDETSLAYSFIINPPSSKEYRKGVVEAIAWFINPPPGLKLYEESLLDPEYGVTVTLLQLME